MWNSGALTTETMHCQEGDSDWQPLSAILHELEPPPVHPHTSSPAPAVANALPRVHPPSPVQPTKSDTGSFIMSLFRIAMLLIAVISILVGFAYPIAWGLAIICLILGIAVNRVA